MLYIGHDRRVRGGLREPRIINAAVGADPIRPSASTARSPWEALASWAHVLAARVALGQPSQHVAVFVPDLDVGALRLVAQIWGAGEDIGEVVVGQWLVPFEGSVCGRVFRTGSATLSADVALDPDYRSFPGGRSQSALTVPIRSAEGVVAVINVEAPWMAAFSVADYERVTAVAAAAVDDMPSFDDRFEADPSAA
jgi:hypothetical protein